ncbi:MAG: di-trans,poly-cis-decaprenylcistransferase [Chlamydiia bacterium]|nr:di-trans,poly-cis-decaprenylcistransferase [Chlamydiia bacterium]
MPSSTHLPKHIAIIMDGNRRWAKHKKLQSSCGYTKGAEQVQDIISAAKNAGTEILTLYAFSTENASRGKMEVATLMHLLETYLTRKRAHMIDEGVRLHTIGDLSKLPVKIQKTLAETKKITAECKQFELILALGYGGRDEICRAAKHFAKDCLANPINIDGLTEELFSNYLDTKLWPDPDLLIRTGGEMRLSNFLLWQISYSEVYITETLWPDFASSHLEHAILEYQNRKRRFGK